MFWQRYWKNKYKKRSLACIHEHVSAAIMESLKLTIVKALCVKLSVIKERCEHDSSLCKQKPCH